VGGQESSSGADIEAAALIPAPPEHVFDFLADLDNHWRLTGRYIKLDRARPPEGGVVVVLRGPLGIRRCVTTRLTVTRRPRLLIGTAELGEETRARVSWTLAGRLGRETRVRLAAEIERTDPLDRLLLAAGGRAWLRRRFEATLRHLAEQFERDSGPAAVGLGLDDDPARSALE
jgi:hypothetical protein